MTRAIIMIIDDTPDHRDVLRRLLQSVGYHVVEASSGAEALCKAQQQRPDLILTALSLPGQAAWETARHLSAQPAFARTPILGTTVYTTLLKPSRVQAIGCVGYVEKPFNMDDVLYRIGQLLPDASQAAAV